MIGRVAELRDGTFQCQFRCLFFWWRDSVAVPYANLADAISHLRRCCPPGREKIRRIVFP